MRNILTVLILAVLAQFTVSAAYAGCGMCDKEITQENRAEKAKKFEEMAKCLKSDKPVSECQKSAHAGEKCEAGEKCPHNCPDCKSCDDCKDCKKCKDKKHDHGECKACKDKHGKGHDDHHGKTKK